MENLGSLAAVSNVTLWPELATIRPSFEGFMGATVDLNG